MNLQNSDSVYFLNILSILSKVFEINMNLDTHIRAATLACAVLISTMAAPVHAREASGLVEDTATKAAEWLTTKTEADGGFGSGFSKGSDIGATADVVMALASAGKNIGEVRSKTGKTALDFFAQQLRLRKAINAGSYAKMALAVKAAGLNPRVFNGRDLVAAVSNVYKADTGVIGDSVFVHCLSMLALARNGASVPEKAITNLESLQTKVGGWAFAGDDAADVDTTALCAQALIAVGRNARSGSVGKAVGYLRGIQNGDGGFPYQSPSKFGTDSNANSTALVAQLIAATGDQPESWAAAKGNPLSALVVLARPSGAIAYQGAMPDDNILASAGAIPALNRKAFGN